MRIKSSTVVSITAACALAASSVLFYSFLPFDLRGFWLSAKEQITGRSFSNRPIGKTSHSIPAKHATNLEFSQEMPEGTILIINCGIVRSQCGAIHRDPELDAITIINKKTGEKTSFRDIGDYLIAATFIAGKKDDDEKNVVMLFQITNKKTGQTIIKSCEISGMYANYDQNMIFRYRNYVPHNFRTAKLFVPQEELKKKISFMHSEADRLFTEYQSEIDKEFTEPVNGSTRMNYRRFYFNLIEVLKK